MSIRCRVFFAVFAVAMLTSSCSVSSAGGPAAASAASTTATIRMTPPVPDQRDARGIAACDLLTRAQLLELKMVPDSAKPYKTAEASGCGWAWAVDEADVLSIQVNSDTTLPALEGIYMTRPTARNFEETQVAGHPAVRSDLGMNECALYVAVAERQGIAATGDALNDRYPGDPCSLARRTLELILSNLPPLR